LEPNKHKLVTAQ